MCKPMLQQKFHEVFILRNLHHNKYLHPKHGVKKLTGSYARKISWKKIHYVYETIIGRSVEEI